MKSDIKKIVYITTMRFPTEKAHGLATVKICEAFADSSAKVDVIAPRLWRKDIGDVYEYYGVKKNFSVKKILCADFLFLGFFHRFFFFLQALSFSFFASVYALLKYRKELNGMIIFSHDYIPLYFATFISNNIFYDIHHFPGDNFMYKRVMRKSLGFAVQTKWKIKAIQDKFGIDSEKIVYWPNGTDFERFDIAISISEARNKLNIPQNGNIVMYTGQFFDWKGVDSLIKSVSFLDKDIYIYLVGGSDKDVKNCKTEIEEADDERIIFIPFQNPKTIPLWLKSANVLVLPNTAKQKVSLYYTSPMKMFEYMASGVPIVASNIPSIVEILNEENCIFAEPDNPVSFAEKINKITKDGLLTQKISARAKNDIRQYTWKSRAEKIINLMSKLT